MISLGEAKKVVSKNIPDCVVKQIVQYKHKWVIYAPTNDPLEGDFDPYYYVDMNTGSFGGFSVMLSENMKVLDLFKGSVMS